MRVAVVLSGSVRYHHKSVASIAMLRSCGHLVDVFMHAWSDAEATVVDSWSKAPAEEPTDELIAKYSPRALWVQSWEMTRPKLVDKVADWNRRGIIRSFTHYGMLGMWLSLKQAYQLIDAPKNYDAVVRLRYDCAMLGGDIRQGRNGWNIPEAVDFGGISDQLAWCLQPCPRQDLDAYFLTHDWIERWLESGCEFGPEVLLKKSLDSHLTHPPHRLHYKFSLHAD